MYQIIKNVILSKDYDLKDMLNKIDEMFVKNKISSEQQIELSNLAQENAESRGSIDLISKIAAIEKRLDALENAEGHITIEYPEYENGHWYVSGDRITYNGKHYKCINGSTANPCVWNPDDYPQGWEIVN